MSNHPVPQASCVICHWDHGNLHGEDVDDEDDDENDRDVDDDEDDKDATTKIIFPDSDGVDDDTFYGREENCRYCWRPVW